MRACLTGAGGFCGKHLSRYLKGQNVEVHRLTTHPAKSSQEHQIDITEASSLADSLRDIHPDYVFHLAGVTQSADPNAYYRINTEYAVTLMNAMDLAELSHVPLLLVGTSAEYGMVTQKDLPITEDLTPHPYNHYGISKLAQTLEGLTAARNGHPIVIARPFNVIGTGMPEHLVVQSFAQQLKSISEKQHPPIINVGNLNSSRDFIDVQDLVESYWNLIRTPAAYGEIVNVCSGKSTTINEILVNLIELSGHKIEIVPDPARFKEVDVPAHYGSVDKLHQMTGKIPDRRIDETLIAIWAGLKSQ